LLRGGFIAVSDEFTETLNSTAKNSQSSQQKNHQIILEKKSPAANFSENRLIRFMGSLMGRC
jgi:hypothetical protein